MQLRAQDIVFSYPNGPVILNRVNFYVDQGETVGLIAPSGRGKSTLAKILAGFETPEQGKVTLDGRPPIKKGYNPVQLIFQHPEKAVNPLWKMKYILAESGEYNQALMDAMGISKEWLDRWPSELSSGELQRICVLRVLNEKTKFIIADEMTTMLDTITQAQIWQVVLSFAKSNQIGIVVISHEKSLIERLCNRVIHLL